MEKVVSTGRLKTDPVSRGIISFLEDNSDELRIKKSILYYDFPLFRDYEDTLHQPSLLILDKNLGVVAIRVADTAFDIARDDYILDEFLSQLFGKLITSRTLRQGRNQLKFNLTSILYLPPATKAGDYDTQNICVSSFDGLKSELEKIENFELSENEILEVRSVIEGIKALSRSAPREIKSPEAQPKAVVLQKLEDEIANFDANQRRAALTVALGPQRIRGLAGSGKTIVLAWKAAHIHLTNPGKRILFTFYTRSLYELIRRQISRFYRHFRDSEPDWEMLNVLHAWGGRTEPGVYYNTCIDHGVMPKTWDSVRGSADPFKAICEDLTKRVDIKSKYDVVLVDEAQDFPDSFFHILFHRTNGTRDEKTIIWAYDEFQSIFAPKMRTADELFGVDADGEPRINLERSAKHLGLSEFVDNDLVLHKCYRNPIDTLVASHAIGLGIYGQQIVQMLENREHWEDIGYEVVDGDFKEGSDTVIIRPEQNSPLSVAKYESRKELVKLYPADDFTKELDWVVAEAKQLIDGGVRPEEILVICLDHRNVSTYFSGLSRRFEGFGMNTFDVIANPYSASKIRIENSVTLSTVNKAKGNEAAAVFVIGIDALMPDLDSRRGRNRLFTAMTRTKCWLRISGLGQKSTPLFDELAAALSKSPRLEFKWPDLRKVSTIQRDIGRKQEMAAKARKEYVKKMRELGYSDEEAMSSLEAAEKRE